MSQRTTILSFIVFSVLSSLFFQNCNGFLSPLLGGAGGSQGTSTGNPSLHLSFAAYGSAAMGASMNKPVAATVTTTDNLQNITVIMCIGNVKFRTIVDSSSNTDIQNVPFAARQVSLSPLGTDLDFISLPPSEYRQVEMSLNGSKCGGSSVVVSNLNGQFSSSENISMKFNGSKNVDFNSQEISLKIQAIVEALMTVTSDGEIRGKIETAIGVLD